MCYNDNVMEANEVIISSLDEFMAAIDEFEGRDMVYRGQSNPAWKVTSTSYRELNTDKNEMPHSNELLKSNEGLIDRHRVAGNDLAVLTNPTDLHVLARARHENKTNMLIDFTEAPSVALFLACQKFIDQNGTQIEANGKVFCLDVGTNGRFYKINDQNEQDSLSRIVKLLADKIATWKPPLLDNNRALKQDSVFVFNAKGRLEDGEFKKIIIIDKKSKADLFARIDLFCNFKEGDNLFPALIEEAQRNQLRKLKNEAATDKFQVALEYHFQGNYEKAIELYDKTIQLNVKFIYAYVGRGNAKANLKGYEDALVDYDRAIELNPEEDATLYSVRGSGKLDTEDYIGAKEDFEKAIQLNPKFAPAHRGLGIANQRLGNHEEATRNFKKAIRLEQNERGGSV